MNSLRIKNFKCFIDQKVEFNDLTILTGANGNGKSTIIQALLLSRLAIEANQRNFDKIDLNEKNILTLGNAQQIIPISSDTVDNVVFELEKNDIVAKKICLDVSDGEALFVKASIEQNNPFVSLPIDKKEFYYLGAERLGPRTMSPIKAMDYVHVGVQGEFTAQVMGDPSFQIKVEPKRRLFSFSEISPLKEQVNAWMDYIFPGVRISAYYDPNLMVAQIRVENNYSRSFPTLESNVGFGVSYVLPIIVDGLIAKKESVLIVENPEVHLHPAAQSRIGFFLATMAAAGVNIIVETHSDHVLNGIQIAVGEGTLDSSKVVVNYLEENTEKNAPSVKLIRMTEKGELTAWPKGFFDQTQVDFVRMLKLRGFACKN